ncbi:Bug family tripartite tricarboxylate transporter substrate binding protein [Roseomonas sp. F4]
MKPTRRQVLAAAAFAPAILTRPAYAFPTRPIRLVVSSAPAASLDTLARVLAPALSARLGQPVVVENQGGANGLIAMQQVARAEPDGHTLLVTGDAIVLAELTLPQAGFTVRDNFAPVVQAVRAAQILATHPGAPFSDIAGYIAAIRARPGALNVGIPSQGGIAQVVHELLSQQLGGLPVEFVSYRGGGPATLDLIARNTDALVITLPAITEQVRQGAIRPLAVTTARRDPALPDVPTLAETVAPGFDVESWQGILAPAATPPAVIARLHEAIAVALRDSAAHARLTGLGFEVVAAGPEEFRARAEAATARFAGVVRRAAPAGQGS